MAASPVSKIVEHLVESRDTIQAAVEDPVFVQAIGEVAELTVTALRNGGKVLLAGNGGSGADSQHIAGEMLLRLNYDRAPIAAPTPTTDTSVLTAIGNDYGYDRVFERQILGLGYPRDVFIAISTSGRSSNILHAIDAARQRRLVVVGFTGTGGGEMRLRCDFCLQAPFHLTPIIQQIHFTAKHIICSLVEERLFPQT